MKLGRSLPRRMALLCGILAFGLLTFALGADEAATEPSEKSSENASQTAAPAPPALAVEGMRVVRDPETGELRAPNAAEAQALAASELFKRPKSAPAKGEVRSDGTLALAVAGQHLSFAVATVNADGKVVTDCLDAGDEGEAVDHAVAATADTRGGLRCSVNTAARRASPRSAYR